MIRDTPQSGQAQQRAARPTALPVIVGAIPDELKERRQWIVWTHVWKVEKGGSADWRKIPKKINGRNAAVDKPATWTTFDEALAAYQAGGYDGVGYVFSALDPYTGIDLDDCRDPVTGAFSDRATTIIRGLDSYTETSPSGTGAKAIIRGKKPFTKCQFVIGEPGLGKVEVYDNVRFWAMTGHVLAGHEKINDRASVLLQLHDAGVFLPSTSCPPADPPTPKPAPTRTAGNRPSAEERCVAYLATCDPAVSGQGGHGDTYWPARVAVYGFDLGVEAGFRVLRDHFNDRCVPPWSDKELLHKCEDAAAKPFGKDRGWLLSEDRPPEKNGRTGSAGPPREPAGTATSEAGNDPVHASDLGNARRLARAYGRDLRWIKSWRKWLTWDKVRWKDGDQFDVRAKGERMLTDLFLEVTEQMKGLASEGGEEAQKRLKALQEVQRWAKASEDAKRLNAMVDLLKSQPGIGLGHDALDRDAFTLCCPNGVLDLRTGRLGPHAQGAYLTRLCPTRYDPEADCPTWERFLCEVFRDGNGPDHDLIAYVQRLLGYCLTGDVREHLLAVLYGSGANGKSVLINVVRAAIGHELACVAAPDLLLARDFDKHPCEIANLFGKRLVVCQEVGTGRRLNEALVKWLTGGDHLQARRMREDPWEFAPTHKAFLVSNHKPEIRGTDNGIWRRIRLIPFDVTFAPHQQDKTLTDRLLAEAPGVLAWMVRGCSHWQAGGLREPDRVKAATSSYRNDEDLVGCFLAERCQTSPSGNVRSEALYAAFVAWSKAAGEQDVTSRRKFGEAMNGRPGITRETSNGTRYRGVMLAPRPANEGEEEG